MHRVADRARLQAYRLSKLHEVALRDKNFTLYVVGYFGVYPGQIRFHRNLGTLFKFPRKFTACPGVFLQAEGVKFLLPPEVSGREGWGA